MNRTGSVGRETPRDPALSRTFSGLVAVMGKVKDETAAKPAKSAPAKGGSAAKKAAGRVAPFFTNLVKADTFKPTQGKNARMLTAVGLGALVAAGLYQLYELHLRDQFARVPSIAIPAALAAAFAWVIWRIVQYPPFADFLIATEAEMNKVSWTSREDLYRATIVVLATVFFMALYLFGVDYIWSWLLQIIGVLKFNGETLGS
jgi:preprotein translocase subunit SecE